MSGDKKKPIQLAGQISNYYTRLVVTISAGLETIALYYQSNIYTYRVAVSSAVYWRATRACGWGEGANNRLFLPDGKLSQVRGRRWCYILLSQTTSSACLTSDVIPSSIWKGKKKYKSIKTLFAIKRKRGGGRKDGNGNTWQTAASGNSCADAFSSFPELATWLVRGSSCYPSDWLSSLFLIYARSVSGCNKDESIPTRQSSVQHQLSHTIYYSDDQYETTTTRAKISNRRWNLRRRPAAGRLTRICPGAAQSVWFAFLKVLKKRERDTTHYRGGWPCHSVRTKEEKALSLSRSKRVRRDFLTCVCVWGGKDHKSEIDLPPPCATIRDKGKKKKKGQKRCQKLYGNNTHGSLSRVSLLLRKSFRQKSESVQPMNGTSSIYI